MQGTPGHFSYAFLRNTRLITLDFQDVFVLSTSYHEIIIKVYGDCSDAGGPEGRENLGRPTGVIYAGDVPSLQLDSGQDLPVRGA